MHLIIDLIMIWIQVCKLKVSYVPLVDQILIIIIYWFDVGLELVILEIYGMYTISLWYGREKPNFEVVLSQK